MGRPHSPEEWEIIRRSTVMLGRGQSAALDRDTALELIEELQRLRAQDREVRRLVERLRAVLDAGQAAGGQTIDSPG